ncbi:unnamed protein product [Prunus armeniaca]
MKNFGYAQSNLDHTLFLKRDGGKITALIIYVDDMAVPRNNAGEQQKLQKYLSQEFEMKDLGALKYFLGIEVARSKTALADTPIETNHKLYEDMDQLLINKEQYNTLLEG